MRGLCQLRGFVVSDVPIQCGHEHQAVLDVLLDALKLASMPSTQNSTNIRQVSLSSRTECMKLRS